MRILAIRLKNLNSLAGEWKIDFRGADYEAEGMFLITGPTGSGKTTLLDALCLALYGRTPRVSSISQEHNEVMTRHTAACLAEVEFETAQGVFFARWSQVRARGRADGRLQPVKWELASATGDILASRTNVKSEVERITGLSYDQFTRALLLAQGGFAAFLTASGQDKSSILEKLTNTDIYSRLSSYAFKRARREEETYQALLNRFQGIGLLSVAEEEEMKAALARGEERLRALEQALAICGQGLDWLTRMRGLREEEARLAQEERALNEKLTAFAPQRQELEQARQAHGREAAYEAREVSRQKRSASAQRLAEARQQAQEVARRLDGARVRAAQAEEAARQMAEELTAALPLWEKARQLDGQLRVNQEKLAARQAVLEKGRLAVQAAQAEQEQKEQAVAALTAQLAQVQAWLAEHARDEWLLEQLGGVLADVARQKSAQERLTTLAKEEREQEKRLATLEKDRRDTRQKLEVAQKEAAQAATAYAAAQARQAALLAGEEAEALKVALTHVRAGREAAVRLKSLDEHRRTLVDGAPCPLCGALTHPYAQAAMPDPDQLAQEEARLQQQLEAVAAATRQMDEAQKAQAVAEGGLGPLAAHDRWLEEEIARERDRARAREEEQAAVRAQVTTLEEGLLQKLAPLALAPWPGLERLERVLQARLAAWKEKRAALARLEPQWRKAREAVACAEMATALAARAVADQDAQQALERCEWEEGQAQRVRLFGDKNPDEEQARLQEAQKSAQALWQECGRACRDLERELGSREGAVKTCEENALILQEEEQAAQARFLACLAGWSEAEFLARRRSPDRLATLTAQATALDEEVLRLRERQAQNSRWLVSEIDKKVTDQSPEELEAEKAALRQEQGERMEERGRLRQLLEADEQRRQEAAAAQRELDGQKEEKRKWGRMRDLIGSADGKKFRAFAQYVTLEMLLEQANRYLAKMTDRYQLVHAGELALEVVDMYQAGERRPMANLSGGEMFLASLALALGLSGMASRNVRLDSLFLDEGFGSLDEETLEVAIEAIASLRQEGKMIGLISHVASLKERLSTRIEVRPHAPGRSLLHGPGCTRL